jgi:hypothetical protein
MSAVHDYLSELHRFLRDVVLNAPEYSRIRPEVGLRIEKLDLYIQGLEIQAP